MRYLSTFENYDSFDVPKMDTTQLNHLVKMNWVNKFSKGKYATPADGELQDIMHQTSYDSEKYHIEEVLVKMIEEIIPEFKKFKKSINKSYKEKVTLAYDLEAVDQDIKYSAHFFINYYFIEDDLLDHKKNTFDIYYANRIGKDEPLFHKPLSESDNDFLTSNNLKVNNVSFKQIKPYLFKIQKNLTRFNHYCQSVYDIDIF